MRSRFRFKIYDTKEQKYVEYPILTPRGDVLYQGGPKGELIRDDEERFIVSADTDKYGDFSCFMGFVSSLNLRQFDVHMWNGGLDEDYYVSSVEDLDNKTKITLRFDGKEKLRKIEINYIPLDIDDME